MPADEVLPQTIGLLTSSLDADYSRRLVAGSAKVLTENGYTPLCFSPGASGTTEYEVPLAFLELVNPKQLAGVIFSPPSMHFIDAPPSQRSVVSLREEEAPSYNLDQFL